MSRSAARPAGDDFFTRFEPSRRARRAALVALAAGVALAFPGAADGAGSRLSREEALALAFPGATIERRTIYLDEAQLARAAELTGQPIASALVVAYEATGAGRRVGTAYFDSHAVRTLPETLMVALDAEGKVRRVEVLAFDEPAEYLPRPAWYEQFTGRELTPELALKRGIRGVTGASLTARATTEAVRRVLAVHRVVSGAPLP